MSPRAFSVEEANALLPDVRAALGAIRKRTEAFRRRSDRIAALELLWGDEVNKPSSPDHHELLAHRAAMARTERSLKRLVDARLTQRGIRFPPGGLEHGLVDFPALLDGRWIYLCWRLGEDRVEHWHELATGFGGRRPITPELARRLGQGPGPGVGEGPPPDI
ncbi:MAG: DUF2203 domain-containing protein [Gemmatimonadota bacterium]|nr:DUF2203 domain-containing protein [Gemmatimonadota bacterium]